MKSPMQLIRHRQGADVPRKCFGYPARLLRRASSARHDNDDTHDESITLRESNGRGVRREACSRISITHLTRVQVLQRRVRRRDAGRFLEGARFGF